MEEVVEMYPDDHFISSLVCTFVELQRHELIDNGVRRQITEQELQMCPLDEDLMKKILNRHCVHCSELINEVITLP